MLPRLKKRSEFLRVASKRVFFVTPSVVIQLLKTDGTESRVGFTASRKVGKAVIRNRAKRRLREVAKQILEKADLPASDIVFVARWSTVKVPFQQLTQDCKTGVEKCLGMKTG